MNTNSVLRFLRELTRNNNREWFEANKNLYLEAKNEVEHFVNFLIPAVSTFDKTVSSPLVKDCMFRIYRDTRFSNDKRPYKTNFGAFIAKGGRKSIYPGYYVHFENENSMIAGGIYMPQPDVLKAIRTEIVENTDEFKKIINAKTYKKYFGELDDDAKLVNAPKDFPKDFPDIDLLKFKNYTCFHAVSNKVLNISDYEKYTLDVFKAMLPFNSFLNEAVENMNAK